MYIPHTPDDVRRMLEVVGVSSVDELYRRATAVEPVPAVDFELPDAMDLAGLTRRLEELSDRSSLKSAACFAGGGAYAHLVHPVVDQLIARTEFLTAYTPYQSEVSQGTLQSIFEFQTIAASLLGVDAANASVYDGASATAEAALMAARITRRGVVLVSAALHPEYRRTIASYLHAFEGGVVEIPFDEKTGATDLAAAAGRLDGNAAVLVMGYPNFFGVIEDMEAAAKLAHDAGALLVSSTAEAAALGLLEAPGAAGADVAVCEGLSLGLPMSFGGPGVGLFGCSSKFVKQMPGRLVGKTVDADGRDAYVLTLAMREQHIRRERATSNICTNHSLCALAVTIHLCLLGPEGFRRQAGLSAHKARLMAAKLEEAGVMERRFEGPFFNELVMKVRGMKPEEMISRLSKKGILAGPALGRWYDGLGDCMLLAATECTRDEDMDSLCSTIRGIAG
jgi:glycine dehydrogenase subunit 1